MFWNALILALREIRRNVLRSILTILGIVIGVAAVIVMVTLGGGATAQVTQQIASLGSNLLVVSPGKRMGPGQNVGAAPFTLDDAETLRRDIPQLVAVAPMASKSMSVIYGNANWSTQITSSTNAYFDARNWKVKGGRLFTDSELRSGAATCVIGSTVRTKLFGSKNPVGANIRLQNISCQVIGLLESKGQSSMGSDQDDVVVIPLRAFQRRIAGNQDINLIQVSVRDGVSTTRVQQDIERLMRERRHLSAGDENNFNVMDMKEITSMLTSTTKVLTALLSAVAAVSLLVGGIGIMNIMLVSVTERTREIGIRLAIGAFEREVLMQFLVEAAVLSSLGGVVGIVLALVSSVVLASLLNVPFIFNAPIVAVAFAFSTATGLVFGYFPARKAAQLDPIEALRYE
ncbi:MAG: FtsX-like permease family protein [Geobacteraceae bacterium]|nr:FtsX-like permease family protein [Geobacteraceae bacterium]NTW80270.1 FtsX-like permease family protein [Geobacteraceae bacterium]